MNDAFDRLERELRDGVRWLPARPDGHRSPVRRRRRRGLLFGLIGAVTLAGGALAAREALEVGEPVVDHAALRPAPDRGQGVPRDASVRVLGVRAKDPDGGPPWALRVFATNRRGACVQVGQDYRGRFGLVQPPERPGERAQFRPLKALPGSYTMCSGRSVAGLPIFKGLRRLQVRGGRSDPRRCRDKRCPVTAVTVIRYGLLGPAARRATFIDPDGRRRATQRVSRRDGGAYLFAVAIDPAPFEAEARLLDAHERRFEQALRAARARGLGRRAALRRAMADAVRARRRGAPVLAAARTGEHIDAVFADGRRIRVAGSGRERVAIPGVGARRRPPPAGRSAVTVAPAAPDRGETVRVSFHSPVTMRRFDEGYRIRRRRQPDGECTIRTHGAFDARNEDVTRGATVVYDLRAPGLARRWHPGRWCVSVTLKRAGREEPIGTAAFDVSR